MGSAASSAQTRSSMPRYVAIPPPAQDTPNRGKANSFGLDGAFATHRYPSNREPALLRRHRLRRKDRLPRSDSRSTTSMFSICLKTIGVFRLKTLTSPQDLCNGGMSWGGAARSPENEPPRRQSCFRGGFFFQPYYPQLPGSSANASRSRNRCLVRPSFGASTWKTDSPRIR